MYICEVAIDCCLRAFILLAVLLSSWACLAWPLRQEVVVLKPWSNPQRAVAWERGQAQAQRYEARPATRSDSSLCWAHASWASSDAPSWQEVDAMVIQFLAQRAPQSSKRVQA